MMLLAHEKQDISMICHVNDGITSHKYPKRGVDDRYEGMLANMLSTLAIRAGFEYDIHLASEGHGEQGENGTWTGMIGKVYRGVSVAHVLGS